MSVKKVDLDQQGGTYASYVIAGDYIFTSICTRWGHTLEEHVEHAIVRLQGYLRDAGATLDDVVKVTVTLKRGENFEVLNAVVRKYFPHGFPARNTILVEAFLHPATLIQIEAIAYKPQIDAAH
jgi:enamine deaminase RidA (YjgF/YER057c/UK114 family)